MERGYAQDRPKNFLPRTAYCTHTESEGVLVTAETPNNARWNLVDALAFRVLPHFRLPTDPVLPVHIRDASPTVLVVYEDDEDLVSALGIESAAGIAQVQFQGVTEPPSVAELMPMLRFATEELESRFDHAEPLKLHVPGMNGKERTISNVWKLFSNSSFVRAPGTSLKLYKQSIYTDRVETLSENEKVWERAQLLKEKGRDGNCEFPASVLPSSYVCWPSCLCSNASG